MKVVHVPFCFYPDAVGGTEVYVAGLARHMIGPLVSVTVAAPGAKADAYDYQGVPVRRFAVAPEINDIRELYGAGDESAARAFKAILADENADVVHLHAFTRGASLEMVRAAKRAGAKVVFTYHTPTVSCHRGTLMRWGREVCDGKLDRKICTRCALHGYGLSKAQSVVIGSLPPAVGRLLGRTGASGGLWTALRMSELVQLRQRAFRELMDEVDQVVALCHWSKELLLSNGVPAQKITVSPHGLAQATADVRHASAMPEDPRGGVKIAYMGRLDTTKGVDVLVSALRSLPELDARLDLYGVAQSAAGHNYFRQLQALAEGDARIVFRPAIESDQVIPRLRQYDVLAVPSRWLETGPLVVLEAFSAGTPVIGSRLGGIAELVEHEVNGLLVESGSVTSWAAAIQRCAEYRSLLVRLRAGIRSPKSMSAVASEMLVLYERLLANDNRALACAH